MSLRVKLRLAAPVKIYDEYHGVYGQIIEPSTVLEALEHSELIGKLDDPKAAKAITALHSFICPPQNSGSSSEILLEVDNSTSHVMKIRWMDEHGKNPLSHEWSIEPLSTYIQYTKPGHLFLLSIILDLNECLLGAYRAFKTLPSENPHCLVIQEDSVDDSIIFETMLTDQTKYDALVVYAAALDPVAGEKHEKTLLNLSKIVDNILTHPEDDKYLTLRLSNKTMQNHILPSWGAMHMLSLLGFHTDANDPDHVTLSKNNVDLALFHRASEILKLLCSRASPDFVAELASPVPWQPPIFTSGSSPSSHWNFQGTHFITPEERWARTERWSAFRRHNGRPFT
jgi:hypothetical protein